MRWWKHLFGKRPRAVVERDGTPGRLPDFAAFPNPGAGATVTIAFASERRSWSEELDLVELLRPILAEHVGPCRRRDDALIVDDGMTFAPQFVSIDPLDDGRGATVSTTIAVTHPSLAPTVFEWQHSQGETVAQAVADGFAQWAVGDLPTLRAATLPEDLALTTLTMTAGDDRRRRVVLGPVLGLVSDAHVEGEHDDGCPCCLFTHCLPALRPAIEGGGGYAVRLYAARLPDGAVAADCRINGADFPAGAAALSAYARTWRGSGLSTRKQYVIVQDAPTLAERSG